MTVFLDLLLSHLAAVEKQKQEEEDEDDEKELHGGNITRLPRSCCGQWTLCTP